MKKLIILIIGVTISYANVIAQNEEIAPIGYKIKDKTHIVEVYADNNGIPLTSSYKQLRKDQFFKVTSDTVTLPDTKVKYLKIILHKKAEHHSLRTNNEDYIKKWSDDVRKIEIDSSDYDRSLWIRYDDFIKYAEYKYPKWSRQFVSSALTVPFRYRISSNSTFNGDFNVGASVGIRFVNNNKLGINFVGFGGFSSISLNSTNNSAITDVSNIPTMALTYGGGSIFDLTNKTQMGIVVGLDNCTGTLSDTYIYQNKLWLSVSFNYKFLNSNAVSAKAVGNN